MRFREGKVRHHLRPNMRGRTVHVLNNSNWTPTRVWRVLATMRTGEDIVTNYVVICLAAISWDWSRGETEAKLWSREIIRYSCPLVHSQWPVFVRLCGNWNKMRGYGGSAAETRWITLIWMSSVHHRQPSGNTPPPPPPVTLLIYSAQCR